MSEKPQGCLHVSKNQCWLSLAKHSSCCPRLDAAKEEEDPAVSPPARGPQLPPCRIGEFRKGHTHMPLLAVHCDRVAEVYYQLLKYIWKNDSSLTLGVLEPLFLLANLALTWQFICIIFKHHWQIEFKSSFCELSSPLASQWIKANTHEKEQGHFF